MMVTVAIVAILAAIAFPSYTAFIMRGHRAAAKTEMMDIAAREQQFLLANRRYADEETLSYTLPSEVSERYELEIDPNEEGETPSFLITFTPIGAQAGDVTLTLDNVGNKTPPEAWKK
jgi:type IV pilus assembly protein PilE